MFSNGTDNKGVWSMICTLPIPNSLSFKYLLNKHIQSLKLMQQGHSHITELLSSLISYTKYIATKQIFILVEGMYVHTLHFLNC